MERNSKRKRARWLTNLKTRFAFSVGKNLEEKGAVLIYCLQFLRGVDWIGFKV